MPAYLIVDMEVTDPEQFEEYRKLAPAAVQKYGAKYLARGGRFEVLEGDWTPSRVTVLEFESLEQAKEWWDSPEYRKAREARRNAAKVSMIAVEGM